MTREEIAEQSSQPVEEWRQKYYLTHRSNSTDEELFECLMLEAYANERVKELRDALYQSIVELEYVQCVENCSSGLCASSRGKELVNSGMNLLGIKDLSGEMLAGARAVLSEEGRGKC